MTCIIIVITHYWKLLHISFPYSKLCMEIYVVNVPIFHENIARKLNTFLIHCMKQSIVKKTMNKKSNARNTYEKERRLKLNIQLYVATIIRCCKSTTLFIFGILLKYIKKSLFLKKYAETFIFNLVFEVFKLD